MSTRFTDHEPPPSGRSRGAIRQSYALVVDGSWGRWVALIILALMVSGLEAIGAGLIFVLISLITDPDAGVEAPLLGDISDWFPDVASDDQLVWAAAAVGLFFVARGVVQVIQAYAQHRISYNAGARLSVRLVRGYLAMPYPYHLRRDSAELVRNAITSVNDIVSRVVLPATRFVAEVLLVTGMTIVLIATAPTASAMVIAILGPTTYLVLRLVKTRVKRYGRIATDSAGDSLRTLQHALHGIRDVRLLGRESFFVRAFRRERIADASARAWQATFSQLTSVLVELLLMLFIVAFVIFTVSTSGTAGEGFAVLGLFAYVAMRLKPSIQKIISAANSLRFATPAIDDLHHDLEDTAEFVRRSKYADSESPPRLKDRVRLEEVTFRYDGGRQSALKKVDLEIRAGESIGLCGPTGGGKSTLIDIIAGLLVPTSGQVTVDGVDIHTNVRNWHSQFGFVSQNIYLFDDTLRSNVALGISEKDIDEAAVRRAVEMAQLGSFAASLPDGLDTRVGEHGTSLSGGQRQRVAIARALYRDPSILLLDEGTSALDNETEREFIDALERLHGQKTIILVAHRLTTIQKCDRVFFVEDGHVVGGGTYDELYEESATFRRMAV